MDLQDRLALALHTCPGIGTGTLVSLLRRFGSPAAIAAADSATLKAAGCPPAMAPRLAAVADGSDRIDEHDYSALAEAGVALLWFGSPAYPAALAEIDDPPPVLYARGRTALLATPQIAVVGSRNASRQGCENAWVFARDLARAGITVTSGLALGIDAEAHRGALAAGGDTVAVLGTGIDVAYPRRNAELFDAIADVGAVVTEMPPGSPPRAGHFPRRNRIIAGLSLGCLVVEAAVRSGSLITARLGLDYGREVFAVPGSIHNPRSRGTHALIRAGAKLAETTADILEEVAGPLQAYLPAHPPGSGHEAESLPAQLQRVLDAIGFDVTGFDAIARRAGLAGDAVAAALVELELAGRVAVDGAGYVRT